jgi:hypothetical protein
MIHESFIPPRGPSATPALLSCIYRKETATRLDELEDGAANEI